MEHYRAVRAPLGFLGLCKDPAASAEVTVYARDWLGVDAAIIFSDILVVLESLGLDLRFSEGDGPKLGRLEDAAAIDRLRDPVQAAADLGYVAEAIRLTVAGLPADVPLIGFCGAPFTLASYALEGGASRSFARTRAFMYKEPAAWHRLGRILAVAGSAHLANQVAAGATAVQIFDSWVGQLTRADFTEFAAPHLAAMVAGVPSGVPVTLFGTGTGHLLDLIRDCGADVVGIDTPVDLGAAWASLGQVSVQGNLDPALLLATPERLADGVREVLRQGGRKPGHIVNLGHGVLKETDPWMARRFVELVAEIHQEAASSQQPAKQVAK